MRCAISAFIVFKYNTTGVFIHHYLNKVANLDTLCQSRFRTGQQRIPIMLEHLPPISLGELSELLTVGDCVFIRIPFKPFRLVAAATGSWTNHVGVVIECGASGPVIAESKFPFSRKSSLRGFLGRSEGGRVAVSRLNRAISGEQRQRLKTAATRRLGAFYDT